MEYREFMTKDIVERCKEYFEDFLNPIDIPEPKETQAENAGVNQSFSQAIAGRFLEWMRSAMCILSL